MVFRYTMIIQLAMILIGCYSNLSTDGYDNSDNNNCTTYHIRCTTYHTQCTLYSVHGTLYSVPCTTLAARYTFVYNIQCIQHTGM